MAELEFDVRSAVGGMKPAGGLPLCLLLGVVPAVPSTMGCNHAACGFGINACTLGRRGPDRAAAKLGSQ